MALRQILLDHSFTGWHRSVIRGDQDRKLRKWHQARLDVCKEVLSQIRGGKDVFQHLLVNGWLDVEVQLMPYIPKKGLAVNFSDLKKFSHAFVISKSKSKTEHEGFSVFWKHGLMGLVDSALRVRPFIVQSPIVTWVTGDTTCLYASESFRPEFQWMVDCIHNHYSTLAEHLRNQFGEAVQHQFCITNHGSVNVKWEKPVVTLYSEDQKRIRRPPHYRNAVKATLFFGQWSVSVGVWPETPYLHVGRKALQLQLQDESNECQFV